jgi:hypothetical protein
MSNLVQRIRSVPRGELVALGLLTGIFVVSIVWHPSDDGGIVLCPFRSTTGLPCPGCGLTHAFCAIAKGHVERGFEYHALGPAVFLVACFYWVRGVAAVIGYRDSVARFDETIRRWRLLSVGLAVLLIAWVVHLVELGSSGQLSALAHQGALFRFF